MEMKIDLDKLSNLPESLKFEILLNLPTKDVVKTSVLSHLWRYVPGLDLGYGDFPNPDSFVSFVDSFLEFNSESRLHKFKLKCQSLKLMFKWKWDGPDLAQVTRWIDTVLKRKVQHLNVLQSLWQVEKEVDLPLTLYTCESLVSIKLCDAILPNPKSVSLPSVKVIHLILVKFANDWAFEMLILGCPLLETLTIERSAFDNVKALRVRSQSLLSFTYFGLCVEDLDEGLVDVIDAPRLEKLELSVYDTDRFVINDPVSLVKVSIDVQFNLFFEMRFDPNDLPRRNLIRNFLVGISPVTYMVIPSDTLEVIYKFSRCEQLPLLHSLSSLRVNFSDYKWEMLPIFLESCPNLKTLTLEFSKSPWEEEGVGILHGPRQFLTSLESVKIVKPMLEEEAEIKLVSYVLENSTILKEFTLCLSDFRKSEENVILKKLLAIPSLSSSCQVFVR